MEVISSSQNNKVKLIKHLQNRRWREKSGLAFIEGLRLVEDVIKSGANIEFVGFFPDLLEDERGRETYARLQGYAKERPNEVPFICFEQSLMQEVMQTVTPQSTLAVVNTPNTTWEEVLSYKTMLVLNGVQDPGNLGTMIRTADALGIGSVVTTKGTCDIYNPKALRGAMASTFNIPIMAGVDSNEIIEKLITTGFAIVSTAADAQYSVADYDFKLPTAIVLGNEGSGVEDVWMDTAHSVVSIPIKGDAESLNVSIAGAILMYELAKSV